MRIALLLLVCGCATWKPGEYRPLGDSGVVCAHEAVGPPRQAPGGVLIACHSATDPLTSRQIIIGERGTVLEAKIDLSASAR